MPLRATRAFAAVAAAFLLGGIGCASPARVATVGHPVSIALPSGGASAGGEAFVEVEVLGYQPSLDGPVTLVVEGSAAGRTLEIGRVGVFPDRPFSSAEPAKAQRFSLPLPASLPVSRLSSLRVRLEPTLGTGAAARAEVAGRLVYRR